MYMQMPGSMLHSGNPSSTDSLSVCSCSTLQTLCMYNDEKVGEETWHWH